MKRANGAGSVEVLADGRARIRAVVDGKRRQIGPIYPDRATALRMLAAWNAERAGGEIVVGAELTLAKLGADWLDRREINGSSRREQVRSIKGERSVWSRHVAPSAIAALPVVAITTANVKAFALELRRRKALHAITKGPAGSRRVEIVETSRPLSRAMQREALRLVRSVLADAIPDVIDRNPADGVEVARGSVKPRDLSEDWLRWPEALALVGCEAIARRDRRAYACAIGLALRLNDLKSIEIEHIDLETQVPGPGIRVWIEKGQKWHRVPVMPWLAPLLREQLASLPAGARFLFPREDGDRYAKGYDFGWGDDRERDEKGVVHREPSALERAGVRRRIRFHDLRGTCATHLALGTWGRTWSMHEIQSMLAHSDQRVTERYVRRAIDMLSEAAKATPGCPGLPLGATGTSDATARNDEAPGAGVEPATNRLTALRRSEQSREVASDAGQPQGNVAELAARAIVAAAEGDPFALRRALEVCEAVVLASRAAELSPGANGEAVDERSEARAAHQERQPRRG